jgi:hypothetical protein
VCDHRDVSEQPDNGRAAGLNGSESAVDPESAATPERAPALTPRRRPAAGEDTEAHDVLAAEEFPFPAAPPPRAPANPEDSSPAAPPHDVLAAEEFAFPAPASGPGHSPASLASPDRWRPLAVAVLAAFVAVALAARRRRRA